MRKNNAYNRSGPCLQTETVDLNVITFPINEACTMLVTIPGCLDGSHRFCQRTLLRRYISARGTCFKDHEH